MGKSVREAEGELRRMLRRIAMTVVSVVLTLTAAAPGRAQTLTHVSFVLPLVCFCAAPLYAADKLGYFKDEGLDVELVTVQGSAAMFAAVTSGSAPFGFTNGLTLLPSVTKGLSFVAFAGMDKGQGGINMMVSTAWAQTHGIKPNEEWRSALHKLSGARVGVLGTNTTSGLLLSSALKAAGLPDDAVSMVAMTPAAANAALSHNEIDAWWQAAPAVGGVLAFRSANLPLLNDVVGNVAFTTRDYLTKNRDVVAHMARAIARGDNALLEAATQERALAAVYERMPNLPREEVRAEVLSAAGEIRARNAELSAAAFDATNRIDAQLGLLKSPLTPEQLRGVFTLDLVPKQYLKP